LATQAADTRFGKGHRIDVSQLLNVVRDEDKGDDVWTVFNRIQENLTQPHRITDHLGNMMNGVSDINEDTRINKELFELAHAVRLKRKKEKGWLCHPSFSYFAILFTNPKDEPLQPKKIYNPDANGVLSLPEFMGTNSRNQRDFNCARKNN
jgi:hypothetical protein